MPRSKPPLSPWSSFWVVSGTVFLVEFLVMVLLPHLLPTNTSEVAKGLVDSCLLTLTILPLLWWQIVQPLQNIATLRAQVLEHVYQRQEEERRSIARDLHDGVGQMLTTVLLGVKSAGRAATLDDARQQISEVAPRITETIDELRAISAGLRPAVLDDLGLAPALERLLEDVAQVSGLAGTFEGAALAQRRWPPNVETTVFRVVQEALQNVVKHGQARQVTVRLLEREGSLLCSVVDDGRGFDVGAGHGLTAGRGGVGLSSMRERAELAGGSLDVFSTPGRGTQVTIAIPEVDLAPLRTGTKQGQA